MLLFLKTFGRLSLRTFFQPSRSPARLTLKRLLVMSVFLPVFFGIQCLHWLCFWLDDLFFSDYRNIEVRAPLFIVGVPRSGTTFLHRVLAGDTERFTTLALWELLLAPAITEKIFWLGLAKLDRLAGGPIQRLLEGLENRLFHQLDGVHPTALGAPEEDYLLLLPVLACFLLVLPFPFSDDIWNLAYFDSRLPQKTRDRVMAHYRACLQRHLYVRGRHRRVLSKNPSFSPMIDSLNAAFPKCRVICTLRNPLTAVPSHISAMMAGAALFDTDLRGNGFRDRLLSVMIHYYRHLTQTLPEWPQKRVVFLTMEDMVADIREAVHGLYAHFDFEMTQAFKLFLAEEWKRSRRFRSGHRYSLEQFDLDPKQLTESIPDIFERFGYRRQPGVDPVATPTVHA